MGARPTQAPRSEVSPVAPSLGLTAGGRRAIINVHSWQATPGPFGRMKPPREAVEPPEAARRRGAPCNRFGTLHYVTSCGRAAGRVP